jgi:hypothetical protein
MYTFEDLAIRKGFFELRNDSGVKKALETSHINLSLGGKISSFDAPA